MNQNIIDAVLGIFLTIFVTSVISGFVTETFTTGCTYDTVVSKFNPGYVMGCELGAGVNK